MGRKLESKIPKFNSSNNLLGCMVHVINLAAKIGIANLGPVDAGDKKTQNNFTNLMSLDFFTSRPGGADVNGQTILKCIHALCKWV